MTLNPHFLLKRVIWSLLMTWYINYILHTTLFVWLHQTKYIPYITSKQNCLFCDILTLPSTSKWDRCETCSYTFWKWRNVQHAGTCAYVSVCDFQSCTLQTCRTSLSLCASRWTPKDKFDLLLSPVYWDTIIINEDIRNGCVQATKSGGFLWYWWRTWKVSDMMSCLMMFCYRFQLFWVVDLPGKVWTVPRGYLWDRLTAGELEFGNKRVLLDTWQAYLIVYVTGQ